MIKSMTAYGRKESKHDLGVLSWEIKSVNHRYLDAIIRSPEELRPIETEARKLISERLNRGKVECNLRYQRSAQVASQVSINTETAQAVCKACDQINGLLATPNPISPIDVLKWPGVVEQAEVDYAPLQSAALSLLKEALDDFVATREREGQKIVEMIQTRCEGIAEHVDRLRGHRPGMMEKLRQKILDRLAEISTDHDPQRLEQELVYQAQRLDVDEELDRLSAHIQEVKQVLKRKEPVGRRLDFLMQELNREANTLSSKSSDAETTRIAVDLKVLIEQMREQIQNVE